ncbi:restriction endonuclease subunit S [Vreelandella rituensis]|uniref:Restriction endonuclease subunit S n=1 Tax=Vreelandella rituensis TaxID=2282306 RepID=A0A368UAB5_9GAMM|nr:restriction endonuclease subunit S [Halomonas rituensis]RCV93407.1 restriction endonuclease subunit S [Halomonas rituensis]
MSGQERLTAIATDGGSVDVAGAVIDHLDLWTSAVTTKSTAGRGRNGKIELTGIKKLRELIMELAVRGKLVDQDPSDESASVLLERIAEEKARLVKEGKIKKLLEVTEEDIPYTAPKSWKWIKFDNLYPSFQNGASSRGDADGEEITVIRLADISNLEISLEDTRLLPISRKSIKKYSIVKNDILIIRVNGSEDLVGQLIPVRTSLEAIYCDHFIRVRTPENLVAAEYLCILSASSVFRSRIKELFISTAGQKTVNQKHISSLPTPLPPLAEQYRIVDKVDELLALCDRLEQHVGDQLEAHETLVDTLLGTLTQSENATELAENWTRLAAHFDTLFTTELSIDKLKQTILQLAVMGRLVEQDPNDEPVTCLLQRYGIKSKPHSLQGWAEVALGSVGKILGGSTPTKSKAEFWDGSIPWVSPKDMKLPLIQDSQIRITEQALKQTTLKVVPENSLIMVVRGMILAHSFPVAITGREVTINQDMKALVPPKEISTYLLLYMQAGKSKVVELVDRSSHGTCKLISEKLWSHAIHLPPMEEQARIVQKVDELMAICAHLKERLNQASETRCQLAEAVTDGALH